MKKLFFLCIVMGLTEALSAQKLALKNNLLYDATLTPNLSLEIGLGPKTTLDIGGGYNPFTFNDNKKFKHWLAQPELRFWFCERFNGSFWGVHLHGGEFNVGGIKLPFGMFPSLEYRRFEGFMAGAGVSFGHQWILGNRWNLEASIGAGYAYLDFDKYECEHCGDLLNSGTKHYFGVTRATLSLIYFFR